MSGLASGSSFFGRAILGALALVVVPGTAHATDPPMVPVPGARAHDGFYLRGGASTGGTWLDYHAPMITGVTHEGKATGAAVGGEIAVGWTLPFGLVLGATLFGHHQGELDFDNPDVKKGWDESVTGMTGIGAFGRFYPWPHAGLFAEASISGVTHRTRNERRIVRSIPWSCPVIYVSCMDAEIEYIVATETASGYELAAGAGYGFWISNQWTFDLIGRMQVAHTFRGERSYWFLMPTLGIGFTYN